MDGAFSQKEIDELTADVKVTVKDSIKNYLFDLFRRLTSRCFWIWAVSVLIIVWQLNTGINNIFWGVCLMIAMFLYYGGDLIRDSFAKLIGNTEVKASLSAGANLNVKKDI